VTGRWGRRRRKWEATGWN